MEGVNNIVGLVPPQVALSVAKGLPEVFCPGPRQDSGRPWLVN